MPLMPHKKPHPYKPYTLFKREHDVDCISWVSKKTALTKLDIPCLLSTQTHLDVASFLTSSLPVRYSFLECRLGIAEKKPDKHTLGKFLHCSLVLSLSENRERSFLSMLLPLLFSLSRLFFPSSQRRGVTGVLLPWVREKQERIISECPDESLVDQVIQDK